MSSNESADTLIRAIAESILRRGLAAPAIFMLETYKPLLTMAREAVHVSQPLLNCLLGADRIQNILPLFESRENVEKLVVLLEAGPAIEKGAS